MEALTPLARAELLHRQALARDARASLPLVGGVLGGLERVLVAIFGAIGCGRLAQRIGAKRTLELTLGPHRREYDSTTEAQELDLDLCGETATVTGTIRPLEKGGISGNRQSSARLERVAVERC